MNIVDIYWTKALTDYSAEWKEQNCFYMYYFGKEPLYIGKTDAPTQIVKTCDNRHYRDGVLNWIHKNVTKFPKIKVGIPYYNGRWSAQIFDDIESVLIYHEFNERGYCRANNSKTRTIGFHYKNRFKIVNHDLYAPLRKTYRI